AAVDERRLVPLYSSTGTVRPAPSENVAESWAAITARCGPATVPNCSLRRTATASSPSDSRTAAELSWVPSGTRDCVAPCSHSGGPASTCCTAALRQLRRGNQRRSGTRYFVSVAEGKYRRVARYWLANRLAG